MRFMRYLTFATCFVLLGCAPLVQTEPQPESLAPNGEGIQAPAPPPSARTVEQFDTTTQEEREAAVSTAAVGSRLGETVATLGDAASPGFWVATPLVERVTSGRVVNTANGKSVEVELRPVTGGSSRVSLAALRLLDAPLTELVTLEVFRR